MRNLQGTKQESDNWQENNDEKGISLISIFYDIFRLKNKNIHKYHLELYYLHKYISKSLLVNKDFQNTASD